MGEDEIGAAIKHAQERRIEVYKKRPSAAKSTGHTHVRQISGTSCEISQGNWRMISDQSKNAGGNDEGPDPGFFGRAALGACLVHGYVLHFARHELNLRAVDVDIHTDIDAVGSVGLDDTVPPGYSQLRYTVQIDSDEDELVIREAIDYVEQHSPWLYNMTAPLAAHRKLIINSTG